MNHVEKLADSSTSLILNTVHFDQFLGNLKRRAEFQDSPRPELVRVEVVHADRHDSEAAIRGISQRSQGHDGDTCLQGQQVAAVVAASFWEDTHAATALEPVKDRLINLGLINMWGDFELGALVAILDSLHLLVLERAVLVYIVASGKLGQGEFCTEWALDANFLGSMDFGNLDIAATLTLGGGKEDDAAHLCLLLEICANAANKGWVVDGVGKIDGAIGRLGRILGSANGHGTDLARGPSDEALDRLLGDEEGDAAFSLIAQGAL